jgi:3-oxoacyl-[acyl-carrier-protein] synthase-3
VRVSGTGAYLPPRVVDNIELETMVTGFDVAHSGSFPHWVDQVTHIHERRFCEPGTRGSDQALLAAAQALETAGVEAKDVGMIVYATFTPSQLLPGDHCLLAEHLGAHRAATFHLMGACAGSIYGMGIGYSMITAGVYDHVLVVGTETASCVLNFCDPLTSILFGDGAGAVLLSRNDEDNGKGMFPPDLTMEFSPRNIHMANSNVPVDVGNFPDLALKPGVALVEQATVEMEGGPSVLRQAVLHMAGSTARSLGYEPKDIRAGNEGLREALDRAWIVPHQANGRIIDGLSDRLGLPPERCIRTIYEYGNVSAASNLIALDYGVRYGNMARRLDEDGHVVEILRQPEHQVPEGSLVVLPSIGGGYLIGTIAFVL